MFGRATAEAVAPLPRHRQAGRAVRAGEVRVDRPRRRAGRDRRGAFDADVLVVALGADLDPRRRPGWSRRATSSTRSAGAFALRDVLADFAGGRVIVGVTSTPFKCPPAPSETALLMHDLLTERGLREYREITL